jgi:hypothetical protein
VGDGRVTGPPIAFGLLVFGLFVACRGDNG